MLTCSCPSARLQKRPSLPFSWATHICVGGPARLLQADLHQLPLGPQGLAVPPEVLAALSSHFRPSPSSSASGSASKAAGRASLPVAPLELELELGPGPLYRPSYRLYVRDAAVDQLPVQPENGQCSSSAAGSEPGAGAGETQGDWAQQAGVVTDEEAATVVALMPPALRPHLLPFITTSYPSSGGASSGRALMEVVVDAGRDVWVRLRDGTKLHLPVQVGVGRARAPLPPPGRGDIGCRG